MSVHVGQNCCDTKVAGKIKHRRVPCAVLLGSFKGLLALDFTHIQFLLLLLLLLIHMIRMLDSE
jgi:hypothetical protein